MNNRNNKFERKPYNIPKYDLLQGITLSLENSDRHRGDAEVLAEKGRYNSSIVSLYISIEEFAKALWLAAYLFRLKDVYDKIPENEGNNFTKHRYKIDLFFEYLEKIDGYQKSSGKNEFVKMAELIPDEQEYKLKMLYVDWNGREKPNRFGEVWWNPNFIWQIAFFDEYSSNSSLTTKYNELKNDLEMAISYFRKSTLYQQIKKIRINIPHTGNVIRFVEHHFLLQHTSGNISGHANSKEIRISLSIPKSANWVDDPFLKMIEEELRKNFNVNDVKVEIYQRL